MLIPIDINLFLHLLLFVKNQFNYIMNILLTNLSFY